MTRLRRLRIAVFVGATLGGLLAGPALAVSADDPQVEEGRRLFENACSSCHGIDGQGNALGPRITDSGAAGAHFMLTTGRMPLDNPQKQPVRKPPAFDEEQIDQITRYVASLGSGPEIPDVDLEGADLDLGQQLFSENCAACHSSAGVGGAVGAGLEAPALLDSTPIQVVEAMRIGPGAMPVFEQRTLNEHEADSIARYLAYLRRSPDPGGLGMRRIGPIAEGFVAWVVGLGLLYVVCRKIGENE